MGHLNYLRYGTCHKSCRVMHEFVLLMLLFTGILMIIFFKFLHVYLHNVLG